MANQGGTGRATKAERKEQARREREAHTGADALRRRDRNTGLPDAVAPVTAGDAAVV